MSTTYISGHYIAITRAEATVRKRYPDVTKPVPGKGIRPKGWPLRLKKHQRSRRFHRPDPAVLSLF
ncbi:MAG: hypothetical protein WBP75_05230, partial [Candidatus Cybelea sp.]